jgi:rubrerythrin
MFGMRQPGMEAEGDEVNARPGFRYGTLAFVCRPCGQLMVNAPAHCGKCGAAITETIVYNLPGFMLDDEE